MATGGLLTSIISCCLYCKVIIYGGHYQRPAGNQISCSQMKIHKNVVLLVGVLQPFVERFVTFPPEYVTSYSSVSGLCL